MNLSDRLAVLILRMLSVQAIPYSNIFAPAGIVVHSSKWVFDPQLAQIEIMNGTDFCQWYYTPWWEAYKKLRLEAQVEARKSKGRSHWKDVYAESFTDYPTSEIPNLAAPVEAYAGEAFCPLAMAGWRYESWGCFLGCQDIRKTIEWIIAKPITRHAKKQVRARRPSFAFKCPPGYMAKETEPEFSLREDEPDNDIASALDLLNEDRFSTTKDPESIHGSAPIINSCECVQATPLEMHKAAVACREKIPGTHGKLKKPSTHTYWRPRINPLEADEAGPSEDLRKKRAKTNFLQPEDAVKQRISEASDALICYDAEFPIEDTQSSPRRRSPIVNLTDDEEQASIALLLQGILEAHFDNDLGNII